MLDLKLGEGGGVAGLKGIIPEGSKIIPDLCSSLSGYVNAASAYPNPTPNLNEHL